ncbi:hypothetical protein HDV00_002709 [Rhizophlyctis rosea]|nr:hypothetical protein HDV00_002709 [Rhizophlyctis rosea]
MAAQSVRARLIKIIKESADGLPEDLITEYYFGTPEIKYTKSRRHAVSTQLQKLIRAGKVISTDDTPPLYKLAPLRANPDRTAKSAAIEAIAARKVDVKKKAAGKQKAQKLAPIPTRKSPRLASFVVATTSAAPAAL